MNLYFVYVINIRLICDGEIYLLTYLLSTVPEIKKLTCIFGAWVVFIQSMVNAISNVINFVMPILSCLSKNWLIVHAVNYDHYIIELIAYVTPTKNFTNNTPCFDTSVLIEDGAYQVKVMVNLPLKRQLLFEKCELNP